MEFDTQEVEDKRLFERFQARFPAKFKDTRSDFGSNLYLRDASAEGARLATRERLYLNDNISVEVHLPDGNTPMLLKGEVVWTKSTEPNLWDVGIKLHNTDLMHMSRLYKFAAPDLPNL